MNIVSPRFPATHPDRALQCEGLMGAVLDDVLDAGLLRGWDKTELLNAMVEAIEDLRLTDSFQPHSSLSTDGDA